MVSLGKPVRLSKKKLTEAGRALPRMDNTYIWQQPKYKVGPNEIPLPLSSLSLASECFWPGAVMVGATLYCYQG